MTSSQQFGTVGLGVGDALLGLHEAGTAHAAVKTAELRRAVKVNNRHATGPTGGLRVDDRRHAALVGRLGEVISSAEGDC